VILTTAALPIGNVSSRRCNVVDAVVKQECAQTIVTVKATVSATIAFGVIAGCPIFFILIVILGGNRFFPHIVKRSFLGYCSVLFLADASLKATVIQRNDLSHTVWCLKYRNTTNQTKSMSSIDDTVLIQMSASSSWWEMINSEEWNTEWIQLKVL
jgi:hypothetical protein